MADIAGNEVEDLEMEEGSDTDQPAAQPVAPKKGKALEKAKKKYKVKETKRELASLVVVTGKKVQNACVFRQWEKKLRSWLKLANCIWILRSPQRKAKYPSLFTLSDEHMYIAIESAVTDRVLLSLVQSDAVGESGTKALEALQSHFSLEDDEFTIDLLDNTLQNCFINKDETVEEWLVRRKELEDLLSSTYRKKTDDQLLTLLRKSLPEPLKEVNKQLTIKGGKAINDRAKYEFSLKSYAKLIGYPHGDAAAAPSDSKYRAIDGAMSVTTSEKESFDMSKLTQSQIAAIAQILKNTNINRKELTCTHCNKSGHDKESCWKLHPEKKPEWVRKRESGKRNEKPASLTVSEPEEEAKQVDKETTGKGKNPALISTNASKNSNKSVKWDVACVATRLEESASNERPQKLIPTNQKAEINHIIESDTAIINTANQNNESLSLLGSGNYDLSRWIIDSGCSRHVTPAKNLFTEIELSNKGESLIVADGRTLSILGHGTVELSIKDINGNMGSLILGDVAWVPDFAFNLISTTRLQDKGGEVALVSSSSAKPSTISFEEKDIKIPLSKWNNLYVLISDKNEDMVNILSQQLANLVGNNISPELAHARLGHKSMKSIKKHINRVDGLNIADFHAL